MAPERIGSTPDPLAEAERITQTILEIESVEMAKHVESFSQRLEPIRSELGYLPAAVLDDSSVVDTRVSERKTIVSPQTVSEALPLTPESIQTTQDGRKAVEEILLGQDDRLMVVVGPCSIHDAKAALEYAGHVKLMREAYGSDLEVIMRDYSEKPRTELGWKGLLNDPYLDGSNNMNVGIVLDRMLALQITNQGVPLARERLNHDTPQYVNGLVAYDTIGARNAEDQNARVYASGTSSPVGIKHGTNGSVDSAVSACVAANGGHVRMRMGPTGRQELISTSGNRLAHVILRGGPKTNFDEASVTAAQQAIRAKNVETDLHIPEGVVIDFSHKNKVNDSQEPAAQEVTRQIAAGSTAILGVMIESNMHGGSQKLDPEHPERLQYGVSITDSCISIDETHSTLALLAEAVQSRRRILSDGLNDQRILVSSHTA